MTETRPCYVVMTEADQPREVRCPSCAEHIGYMVYRSGETWIQIGRLTMPRIAFALCECGCIVYFGRKGKKQDK